MKPFLRNPVPGWPVSQRFGVNRQWYPPFTLRNGQRWPGAHEGLDLAAPLGTPVRAAHDGVITEVTRVPAYKRVLRKTQPPYGENLRIETQHEGNRITTIYAHLDHLAPWVKRGLPVDAGTIIGWTGGTGRVLSEPGYHLHFGVNINDYPVDPAPLIIGGVSDNDLHPLIDPSPLTQEETDGLLRAIWQDGTDEDRETMRRAGFDFGEAP